MIEMMESVAEHGKRDLFFLAKEILDYKDMVERVHRPVCDFFVRKDPTLPIGKQSRRKNRALFDPRSHYKTSTDIADTVQWILCFPNVRILMMSGTKDLTKRLVSEVAYHFEKNRAMREVYPEYCAIDTLQKTTGEFTVPNRTEFWREPTVSIATIDSVKAGGHYNIRKGDDVVNEDNSKNPEQLKQTISDWKATRPLVPQGYSDFIDTRYDFSDAGGDIIEGNPPVGKPIDLDGFGYMWHGRDWDIFLRACWKIDEQGKKSILFPEKHCTDEDFDPEKENLDAIQREDPYLFACQYMNNPAPGGTQSFSREMLMLQTTTRSQIPSNCSLFMAWYPGFNPDDSTDPAVGIVGGFSPDGCLYIIDCFRGSWSVDKIIESTFTAHRKWCLRRIGFDDRNGPVLIGPGIQSKMQEHRVFLPIEYLPVPKSADLKFKSVEALVPLLTSKKLFFSGDMPYYDQMLLEFTRFGKYKYAGIPFAISTLAQHYRSAYQRMLTSSINQEPQAEVHGVSHIGMFSDLQGSVEDCQELSAGIVG